MGIDILGIDIMGVDILGIDIPAPTRYVDIMHSKNSLGSREQIRRRRLRPGQTQ